jgi:hypothetical protein
MGHGWGWAVGGGRWELLGIIAGRGLALGERAWQIWGRQINYLCP